MLKKCLFATIATISAAALSVLIECPANAIINYGSMVRNTTAPTGSYADSGWQYAGFYGNNSPVWPVSENWALQAAHTNPAVGSVVLLNGQNHTVVETSFLAGTDMALVRVATPFATYAPLYSGGDETGREMMVFGSGFNLKDQPILQPIPGTTTNRMVGHTFRNEGPTYSWGRNSVARSRVIEANGIVMDTLYSTYDRPTLDDGSLNPNSVGADEAMAGFGDSSGGVFIQQDGQWRLAGIIYAIDSGIYHNEFAPAPPTPDGPWVGAISDYRDMWVSNRNGVRERVTGPDPIGAGFYSSRIATYRSWIDATTGQTAGLGVTVVPEAGTAQLALLGAGCLAAGTVVLRRRR